MIWRLLTVVSGTAVVALAVVVIWQLADRARWRRRFGWILDVDREIEERQRACDADLAARHSACDAELAARRGALDAEAANQVAELELARRDATQELDETMRRIAELHERYASAKGVHDRLQGELAVLERAAEDVSFGLYQPIFQFASPEDYKRRLIELRDQQTAMVRDDQAVSCTAAWTPDPRRDGEQLQRQVGKLLVRAFNAECDAVTARVTWNTVTRMIERIKHAFDGINKLGSAMHVALARPYRELKLDELRLEYELEQKRRDQQDEQRAIREQQREEDAVQQALARVCKEAEDDEIRLQRALDPAYRELAKAHGAGVRTLRARIASIEIELREVRHRKERAILRAEGARAGHVYILSNIGSFGETVYRIGMTRRDHPMDHVRELDASVPFDFDVHAMIPSEDAAALERRLHQQFHDHRVNTADQQREFFHVTLDEIEVFLRGEGIAVQLMKVPEARQYRETIELRRMGRAYVRPWQVHDSNGAAYPAAG
jgi:hypothetical protein